MGWSQSYSRDGDVALFEKITGLKINDVIAAKLAELNLSVVSRKDIVLAEDYYLHEYRGEEVQLSDGRVYRHKLASTSRGDDYGHDHYGWFEKDETPKIEETQEEADPSETYLDLDSEV